MVYRISKRFCACGDMGVCDSTPPLKGPVFFSEIFCYELKDWGSLYWIFYQIIIIYRQRKDVAKKYYFVTRKCFLVVGVCKYLGEMSKYLGEIPKTSFVVAQRIVYKGISKKQYSKSRHNKEKCSLIWNNLGSLLNQPMQKISSAKHLV